MAKGTIREFLRCGLIWLDILDEPIRPSLPIRVVRVVFWTLLFGLAAWRGQWF
jgi:hypothetical protein